MLSPRYSPSKVAMRNHLAVCNNHDYSLPEKSSCVGSDSITLRSYSDNDASAMRL